MYSISTRKKDEQRGLNFFFFPKRRAGIVGTISVPGSYDGSANEGGAKRTLKREYQKREIHCDEG